MFKALLWTTAAVGYSAALLIGCTAGFAGQRDNECLRACIEARTALNDTSIIVPGVLAMVAGAIAVTMLVTLALKAERHTYTYQSRKITDEMLRAARLQH